MRGTKISISIVIPTKSDIFDKAFGKIPDVAVPSPYISPPPVEDFLLIFIS